MGGIIYAREFPCYEEAKKALNDVLKQAKEVGLIDIRLSDIQFNKQSGMWEVRSKILQSGVYCRPR